jgi:hypothetical protein
LATDQVKTRKASLDETGWTILALASLLVMGLTALLLPRPILPSETPGLHLDRDAVAAVLARDAELSTKAPSNEAASRLLEIYRAIGRAQRASDTMTEGEANDAAFEMRRAVDELGADSEAFLALRASVVERLSDALTGRLSAEERQAIVGDFEVTLDRFGLRRGRRLVAPMIVVRTLFKARFDNVVHVETTHHFEPVELLAYWGWLALEAEGIDPQRRIAAAAEYEAVGGARAAEARAALLLMSGDLRASDAYDALDPARSHLRWRNEALAALAVEAEDEGEGDGSAPPPP